MTAQAAPPAPPVAQGGDAPAKLGPPYQVGSTTYTPADTIDYDAVGYAGVSGAELDRNATASGEPFNAAAVTAAHKTLPLPSYVEVTSIDTGRTILVRVIDRGPFSNDRLIDLSPGAARQLGIDGRAGVRVRRVNPPEYERAALRGGGQAAERLETPPALLRALSRRLGELPPVAPAPAPKPAPSVVAQPAPGKVRPGASYPAPPSVGPSQPAKPQAPKPKVAKPQVAKPQPAKTQAPAPKPPASAAAARPGWSVQVGAFASKERADALAGKLGAKVLPAGAVYRVRLGPYASEADARAAVAKAAAQGYGGARIVRD